jgi:hypothetical protein
MNETTYLMGDSHALQFWHTQDLDLEKVAIKIFQDFIAVEALGFMHEDKMNKWLATGGSYSMRPD